MNPRKRAEKLLDGFKISLPATYRAAVIEAMVAAQAIAAAESAKKEREACAKICDPPDRLNDLLQTVLRDRAAAIRARSN